MDECKPLTNGLFQQYNAECTAREGVPGGRVLHPSTSRLNLSLFRSMRPQIGYSSQLILSRFCHFDTQPSPQTLLTTS